MRSRWPTYLRAVVVACALGAAFLVGADRAAAVGRFHGDVAGVATGPGHAFVVGDGLYLRFRDRRRASTRYRVCWSHGQSHRCWRRTTGRRKRMSRIFTAAPGRVGTYRVRWRVNGRVVASWSFYNGVGD